VLEIRERTLAPNHFSLATTLEHLATTLAARGKTREALQLYQRALSIRELTLGSDHPSLRASRERIADLQLQASEDSFAGHEAAPPAAAPLRLPPGERFGMPATATLSMERPAAPPLRDCAVPEREAKSATAAQLEKESAFGFEPLAVPFAHDAPVVTPIFERVDASRPKPFEDSQTAAEDPPYLTVLPEIKDELEQTESLARTAEHSSVTTRVGSALAATSAFIRHRRAAVIVGVTIIALPLVAMAMARVARSNPVSPHEAEGYATPAAPLTDSLALAAAMPQGVARPVIDVLRDSAIAPATKAGAPRSRVAESSSSREQAVAPEESFIPTLPRPTVARLDSVVGAMAPSRPVGPIVTLTLPTGEGGVRTSAADENASAPRRAQLIGSLPTPRYPAHLLLAKIGGEVVVRFQVDTAGRPVMSTFSVVSTPDPGLTAAVRRVIPSLRFEPARSPGPEFRAITDVTELSFRFSPDRE
jgi:TonB family protein